MLKKQQDANAHTVIRKAQKCSHIIININTIILMNINILIIFYKLKRKEHKLVFIIICLKHRNVITGSIV